MPKKITQTQVPPKRYTARQTRKFQLRRDHPVDAHVSEILDYSRSKRREVTVIRDGVRLLWALENNDLSILFEMFPHLKEQFVPGGLTLIEQIQSILLQTRALPAEPERAGQGVGLKGMNANSSAFALPVFEDDDDLPTVVTIKTSNSDTGANFLGGMSGLG